MASRPGFLTGLVIGAVFGAGVAVLLGTKLGERVREQLLVDTDEWRARLEETSALARAAADTLAEAGKGVIDQQRARFQEAVREGREAAEETKVRLLAQYERARRGEGDPV